LCCIYIIHLFGTEAHIILYFYIIYSNQYSWYTRK
jgi:hypothetical protein